MDAANTKADASSSSREWDSSLPGTGAQRVQAITQLYFRLGNHDPLTMTVVDALCLVFGSAGATKSDLADYLELSNDRIEFAVNTIPSEMRCTNSDVDVDLPTGEDGEPGANNKASKEDTRHYLNYKRILSVAYAHISQLLLALCASPLPGQSEQVVQRRAPTPAGGGVAQDGATGHSSLNLSSNLRKRGAKVGIFCCGCRCYFGLEEFSRTVTMCPSCGADVLEQLLEGLKILADDKYQRRVQRGALDAPASPTAASPTADAPSSPVYLSRHTTSNPRPELDCPLGRDPFLLQQALAFQYLYSTPFACVNEGRFVVDADEVLTEPEYDRRLQGKASVADQFRAIHRRPSSIYVRLQSQAEMDAKLQAANAQKIAKRAHLPPWLATHHNYTLQSSSDVGAGKDDAMWAMDKDEGIRDGKKTAAHEATITTSSAQIGKASKREREAPKVSEDKRRENLLYTANFVAEEFHEDDYDIVQLRRRTA